MNSSMTFVDLDNPMLTAIEVTLRTDDGVRVLEPGIDYDYNPDNCSFTVKNLTLSGVLTITNISNGTAVGVGKSFKLTCAKKSKQPNYRDILPKRARRW